MNKRTAFWGALLVLGAAASFLFVSSCSNQSPVSPADNSLAPTVQPSGSGLAKKGGIPAAIAVQEKHTPDLMKKAGVVGTAVGLDEQGNPVVQVFLKEEKHKAGIPASLDGMPVVAEVTGEIVAMVGRAQPMAKAAAAGVPASRVKQTPPIQLGTSGGWGLDLANGYCCGGTLGALVKKGDSVFVLSNYHVLEADIVAGGNSRVAATGDPVTQPGLIDVGCTAANAQVVARLSKRSSLPGSNVDASLALVTPGMVRADGAILGIGSLSSSTVAASVFQKVKKSGRTTGLTRSTVSGLNATISVVYENECAGGTAFTKTFTGQIVIANRGAKFLNSGDSGSLLVEDAASNPRAVGLLFAGSSSTAIANPIGEVLAMFGVAMVGN